MRDFSQFDKLIPSVEEQLAKLKEFDREYWNGELAASLLHYQAPISHEQRVQDALVMHAEFATTQETIRKWWQVISGEYPRSWAWEKMKTDMRHLRVGPQAFKYDPDIHPVRIDLVEDWTPTRFRTPEEAFEHARQSHQLLAQSEILSVIGLMPELVRQQGDDFPRWDMVGFRASSPDQAKTAQGVLCAGWDAPRRRIELSMRLRDVPVSRWSQPIILD